jgi:hypothetical protein
LLQGLCRILQESFWGDFQGRAQEMLKKFPQADAEQPMAEYLGLKWHERAKPVRREQLLSALTAAVTTVLERTQRE